MSYLRADPPPSPPGRERELWRRYARERDQAARGELVRLYMPFAHRLASRYADVNEPYDDLVQVASLGLLNAIDRFDPEHGTPFAGYASPTILGELKRHFRDRVWTVRVPRSLHDGLARVEKVTADLTLTLQRSPTVSEIAACLEVDPGEVLEVLEAKQRRRPVSLDRPPNHREDDEGVSEWLGEEDRGYAVVEDRLAIESILPDLDERSRAALELRFGEDLRQADIADRIGVSQMQVSRILSRTLEAIRAGIESRHFEAGAPDREGSPPSRRSRERLDHA